MLAKLGNSWEEHVKNSENPHPNDLELPLDSAPAVEDWRSLVKKIAFR
jgi:hypothetical protein